MIEETNPINSQVLEQARQQLENVSIANLMLQIAQLSRGDTHIQALMFKIILAEGHNITIPDNFAKEVTDIINKFLDSISISAHVTIPPEDRIEDIKRIINYFEEESKRKVITYWQILVILIALTTADAQKPLQRNGQVSTVATNILKDTKTNKINTFWRLLFLHALSEFENSEIIKNCFVLIFKKHPEIVASIQENPLSAQILVSAIKDAQQKYLNKL